MTFNEIFYSVPGSISEYALSKRSFYFAQKFSQENFNVHFIVDNNHKDQLFYGSKYNNVAIHSVNYFERLFSLGALKKPSIIHIVKPHIKSSLPYFLGKIYNHNLSKSKLILELDEWEWGMNGYPKKFYVHKAEQKLLNKSEIIIVPSKAMEIYLRKFREKQLYIPYSLDLSEYDKLRTKNSLSKEYSSEHLVVFSGWLIRLEQIQLIINTAERILKDYPSTMFVIVGKGKYKQLMKQELAKKRLIKNFDFKGFVSNTDLVKYQVHADILLLPIENTFLNQMRCPQKVFEYMATGNPIVTNQVGEVGRVLGDLGFYFEENNPTSLADVVSSILKEKKRMKEKASKSRDLIEKKYDLRIFYKDLKNKILT